MESNKQEKHNLLHDNPIAKHGSWMSKHSGSALSKSGYAKDPLMKGHHGKDPLMNLNKGYGSELKPKK